MENNVTIFAETTFRNKYRKFGIKKDDRRRHMYLIGKTGMGKSTILENMIKKISVILKMDKMNSIRKKKFRNQILKNRHWVVYG